MFAKPALKKNLVQVIHAPWYPFTVAAYPVSALLLHNLPQVDATAGLRSLAITLCGLTILLLILRLIYRNGHRAAFASAMVTMLFFTYGHAYDLISEKWKIPHLGTWMLSAWLLLSALVLAWAGMRKALFEGAALPLNVISLALVLYTAGSIFWKSFPDSSASTIVDKNATVQELVPPEGASMPDIYYIIVDSYARSDLLERDFSYDNSAFLQSLEDLGFYVADCTQSNYNRTDISLASSLNMDYLQNLDPAYQPGRTSRRTLWESINRSAVRADLEKAGYEMVAFASGFAWSEIKDARVYKTPSLLFSALTAFETLLLRTTPLLHLEELGWINFDRIDGERYRERTVLVYNSMDTLARMPGPKFVFIHLIPPHPPFIYAPDGSPTDPAAFLNEQERYSQKAYTEGYRNEVKYISGQIKTAVETLLAKSAVPPIIILQGDHGPWLQTGKDNFLVLNAYYLPGHSDLLYRTISPVNTFRLVFDTYFGTHYGLLPDISYYSPIPKIYEFVEVENSCQDR